MKKYKRRGRDKTQPLLWKSLINKSLDSVAQLSQLYAVIRTASPVGAILHRAIENLLMPFTGEEAHISDGNVDELTGCAVAKHGSAIIMVREELVQVKACGVCDVAQNCAKRPLEGLVVFASGYPGREGVPSPLCD